MCRPQGRALGRPCPGDPRVLCRWPESMDAWSKLGRDNEERMRIQWTALLAGFATAATVIAPLSAQDWPTRPITMIIPFAPGGGVDASGRIQAQRMGELLGQTIVVENVGA